MASRPGTISSRPVCEHRQRQHDGPIQARVPNAERKVADAIGPGCINNPRRTPDGSSTFRCQLAGCACISVAGWSCASRIGKRGKFDRLQRAEQARSATRRKSTSRCASSTSSGCTSTGRASPPPSGCSPARRSSAARSWLESSRSLYVASRWRDCSWRCARFPCG